MTDARHKFKRELARITGGDGFTTDYPGLEDDETAAALLEFSRALDPDSARPRLRKPRADGSVVDVDPSPSTAFEYLRLMRITHDRGFDLLTGTAEEYNDFMLDMVDGALKAYDGEIGRTTAGKYQSAARAFYRFCDEPGQSDDRPDTAIEWPADDIVVFADQSEPRYDEADMFDEDEVDALRKGCIRTQNPHRDRALIEILAGTAQRIEAVRTLRVRDVVTDPDGGPPYILLNPEIRDDGDKGAIEHAGRWRPIVSDVGPIREYLNHHPLSDPAVRREHGAPGNLEDCYLFVGDPDHPRTNASNPWAANGIRRVLERLGNRVGVDKPVRPHNFRHWSYSRSKELDVDESVRRKIFGWAPGSTTGDTVYGHVSSEQAGKQFAEQWAERFDDRGISGVAEQLVGDVVAGDLSPEARQALVKELIGDESFIDDLASAIANDARV